MPEKPAKPDFALRFGRRNSFYLLDWFWFGLVALPAIKHRRFIQDRQGHYHWAPSPALSVHSDAALLGRWCEQVTGQLTGQSEAASDGEKAPGGRARTVLSDSIVGGPGKSPSLLGLDCYNTQHHLCHGANVKCPPQAHVFACLASSWGMLLGKDVRSFRGTASLEEMAHLEWALIAQPYFPPMFCFLIENSVWPDTSYSWYHSFPTDRQCLRTVCKNNPPQVASCETSGQKKLEKYLMPQND